MTHTAMNSITIILALIASFTLCFVLWIYDKSRRDRLKQREKLLDHKVHTGTFDGYAPQYIFCKVWTIDHIRKVADTIGIVLTKDEIFLVIRRVIEKFDPRIGISEYTLKCEIRLFVRGEHLKRLK